MVDLHRILADHQTRTRINKDTDDVQKSQVDVRHSDVSEIPDLFFDDILKTYKLSRIDISVLMYIYRRVWCKPNLYQDHGISPLLALKDTSHKLGITIDEFYHSLKKLEDLNFISTIRSGQFFVRKYFLKEYDEKYSQNYDDFDI